MARGRRKKSSPRRNRGFKLISGLESLAYGSILTAGVMGTSIPGLFGGADIRSPVSSYTGPMQYVNKDGAITLQEIISQPDLSLMAMMDNARANVVPMAVAATTTAIGFRIFKNVLRRPLSNVQRNLVNPIFGKSFIRLT